MNVPEFIIEMFFNRFKKKPSVIEILKPYNESFIEKMFNKKEEIWFYKKVDVDKNITEEERLIEYDATGILIFINSKNNLFILTTPDRKGVAEFTLQNLKNK